MIKLHFAPLTRSIRVRWLLEELGVPYELVTTEYNRDGSRGFAQNTPSGNYPYMEDGDIELSESGAIVQYILERYGNGRLEPPVRSKDRAAYLYWLHFAEGTAASSINTTVWLTVYRDDADRHQEIISAVRDSANTVFGKVEAVLVTQPYIAGEGFSAADIMMGFTLGSAKWLQLLTDAHPKTLEYVDRLFARPALQKSLS